MQLNDQFLNNIKACLLQASISSSQVLGTHTRNGHLLQKPIVIGLLDASLELTTCSREIISQKEASLCRDGFCEHKDAMLEARWS